MWYIVLPCSYYSKEVMAQINAGIEKDELIANSEVRMATFYHIEYVDSFVDDDGQEYAIIHSNGESVVCMLKAEEVNARIIAQSLRLI